MKKSNYNKSLTERFTSFQQNTEYMRDNILYMLNNRAFIKDLEVNQQLFRQIIDKYVQLSDALKEKISEVTVLSETDHLTKIYNRVKFLNIAEKETKSAKIYNLNLSLIIFDIDHFKKVNDTYGHNAGDYVLKTLSGMIKNGIRKGDLFARWGGEEFIVLLPNTSHSQAILIADSHRKDIQNFLFNEVGKLTISLGVAQFKYDEKVDDFIKRADNALYLAKDSGRNCVKGETDLIT